MIRLLRYSLPTQIAVAALLAWLTAKLIAPIAVPQEHTWFQLLMLLKIGYIGLLKSIVGLMVILSIVQGIGNIGNVLNLKRIGVTTIMFYSLTTLIAISLGLGASILMPDWTPLTETPPLNEGVQLIEGDSVGAGLILTKLLNMALMNPVAAVAQGNLLAIVVFSLIFGIALLLSIKPDDPTYQVIQGLYAGVNTVVRGVVKMSPLAIYAIVLQFSLTGNNSLWTQLFEFCLLVFALTAIHGVIILPTLARVLGGVSVSKFAKAVMAPMSMAFATSSSAAALPIALRAAEEKLNLSPTTSNIVLPLGAVMNMDGTALFEGVAAVFLAQLFGVDLSTVGMLTIFIMAMVSSVGAPGMPSGSMSGMQLVMLSVGIPLEAIAILLIVERPLDTFRTAVNVEGDLVAALVVDKCQQRLSLKS